MATQEQLTPTQERIMAVLGDGYAHRKDELRACLDDELTGDNTLAVHLVYLRKRLAGQGRTITRSGTNGQTTYRLCRFLSDDE